MSIVRCAMEQRNFELADAYLEPGLEYCRQRGLDTWRLYLLGFRSRLELDSGRWERGGRFGPGSLARSPQRPAAPRLGSITLGLVRTRRGDPEASAPLAEEHALAAPTEEPVRIGWIAAARAEAALARRETR